ncbi:unnamed protein product [Rotaria sordida]|uniref:Protein quiver n=1 Tax=Rotaria sordida TaxID=392033 RepID=A0A813QIL9_9BILA|nr:unnamed protein product [Rotaria sordida]CAF0768394.1 unnamed protein product [Rotaria sordida]CAF0779740.1 unnamed protein product [Rotaria sordida]CAF0818888.1 unnamed protein product [Rotaria sordida]CAF0827645.1 unnamed protein product [Rotaria sordida]
MTSKLLLLILYLFNIFDQINSREFSLQCWKCEVTIESSEELGVFQDDCQAQFDFTEHTLQDCDGKCWKSVDLLDIKRLGNNSQERLKLKDAALSSLKSSRRCFSTDELLRTAEMGINTSNGCRKIIKENKKSIEICFCSDQDMCNKPKRDATA